jgi:hypothetical protein
MLQPTARPRQDFKTRDLLDNTVGRDSLEEALEFQSAIDGDEFAPAAVMLSRLRDPAFGNESITKIMRDAGLMLPELLDMLRKRDIAIAMARSGQHIGDVLEDISIDAKSQTIVCRACGGEGTIITGDGTEELLMIEAQRARDLKEAAELRELGIDVPVPTMDDDIPLEPEPTTAVCDDCNGIGHLRKIGDADARKLFLGVHGLGQKSGAPAVVVNNNTQINNNGGKSAAESITSKVQKILDVTPGKPGGS